MCGVKTRIRKELINYYSANTHFFIKLNVFSLGWIWIYHHHKDAESWRWDSNHLVADTMHFLHLMETTRRKQKSGNEFCHSFITFYIKLVIFHTHYLTASDLRMGFEWMGTEWLCEKYQLCSFFLTSNTWPSVLSTQVILQKKWKVRK